VSFNIAQTFYYGLTETGRIRSDGDADLTWEIVKNLKLSLSLYNNFDSEPPAGSQGKLDYGVLFGVNYSF
jgi:hypothetical protein